MSELLELAQANAEGKDFSVLPGSVKWVVDSEVIFMNPENGEITDEDAEDRERQISQLVNSILPQAFSGIELNDRFMKYLIDNNVDIDAILTPIADAIGKDNKYVLERLKILTSQSK